MERRDFLRGLGRALRHPLLESERLAAEGPPPLPPERVLVLGAGAAGLGATRALAADGVAVRVLEARDRVGGRCWTADADGVPVDLGAVWIHGVDANPVADLAALSGVALLASDVGATVLLGEGAARPAEATDAALDRYDAVLAGLVRLRDVLGSPATVGDALAELAATGGPVADEEVDGLLRADLGLAHAEDPEMIALRGLLAEARLPGDDAAAAGGLGALIATLADDVDVCLGEPVVHVEHGGDGVYVATAGGEHRADRAICALPLGVLAAGAVSFDPPLPPPTAEALRTLLPGRTTTIAVRLAEPLAPAGAEFLAGLGQAGGEAITWAVLDDAYGAPVLVGWAVGGGAERLVGSDDEVAARALEGLARRLGAPRPDVRWARVVRWSEDPYARGSISSLPPGSDPGLRAALAGAVSPRLLLAGEAGASAHAGTVHGALISGEREASRCMAIMRAVQ